MGVGTHFPDDRFCSDEHALGETRSIKWADRIRLHGLRDARPAESMTAARSSDWVDEWMSTNTTDLRESA